MSIPGRDDHRQHPGGNDGVDELLLPLAAVSCR